MPRFGAMAGKQFAVLLLQNPHSALAKPARHKRSRVRLLLFSCRNSKPPPATGRSGALAPEFKPRRARRLAPQSERSRGRSVSDDTMPAGREGRRERQQRGAGRQLLRPGSEDHKNAFCRMLLETHDPYRPAAIDWPQLDPDGARPAGRAADLGHRGADRGQGQHPRRQLRRPGHRPAASRGHPAQRVRGGPPQAGFGQAGSGLLGSASHPSRTTSRRAAPNGPSW